jgi:hypothetical protein
MSDENQIPEHEQADGTTPEPEKASPSEGQPGEPESDLPEELRNLPPDELRYLQLVATLQKIAGDVQSWLMRAEQALHNHNLRMNVIETLLCHPDFGEMRKKFLEGTLVLADLQSIANDYIQPELQRRAKEMHDAREAQMNAQQAAAAPTESSPIVSPHTGRPASEKPTLLTPDGRQVILRED